MTAVSDSMSDMALHILCCTVLDLAQRSAVDRNSSTSISGTDESIRDEECCCSHLEESYRYFCPKDSCRRHRRADIVYTRNAAGVSAVSLVHPAVVGKFALFVVGCE